MQKILLLILIVTTIFFQGLSPMPKSLISGDTYTLAVQSLVKYFQSQGYQFDLDEAFNIWNQLSAIQNVLENNQDKELSALQTLLANTPQSPALRIDYSTLQGILDEGNKVYYLLVNIIKPTGESTLKRIFFFKKGIELSMDFRNRVGIGDSRENIEYAMERGFWISKEKIDTASQGTVQMGNKVRVQEIILDKTGTPAEVILEGGVGRFRITPFSYDKDTLRKNISGMIDEEDRERFSIFLDKLFDFVFTNDKKPRLYRYNPLLGDLFGFANSEHGIAAVHNSLQDDAIAILHELIEFYLDAGLIKLQLDGNDIEVWIRDTTEETYQSIGSIATSAKTVEFVKEEEWGGIWYEDGHYLLRILQRKLFKDHDKNLTEKIQGMSIFKERAQVIGFVRDSNRVVVRAVDSNTHVLEISKKPITLNIADIESQVIARTTPDFRKAVTSIFRIFRNSPASFHEFTSSKTGITSFYISRDNKDIIGIYSEIKDDPVLVFNAIVEYLLSSNKLQFELGHNGQLVLTSIDEEVTTDEWRYDPHNISHILQKTILKDKGIEGDIFLDLDTPDLGKMADFYNKTTVRQGRYYVSTYYAMRDDVNRLYELISEPMREPHVTRAVALPVSKFIEAIVKRDDGSIEFVQNSIGLRYVLEQKIKENGFVILYGCGENTDIIKEAITRAMPPELAERIYLERDDVTATNIIEIRGRIQERFRVSAGNIAFSVSEDIAGEIARINQTAIKGNELKVIAAGKDSTLYADMIFGFLYAGVTEVFRDNILTEEMDNLLNMLTIFGYSKDDIARLKENLSRSLYFTIKLIRIKDTLEEFQNRRITVEISA